MPRISVADVCDAIAEEINAATRDDAWTGQVVTAARKYLHRVMPEDAVGDFEADTFRATVAPEQRDSEDADRVRDQLDLQVLVTLTKRVANHEPATLDPLALTAELLQDFFEDRHPLTGLKNCWAWGTELVVYDPIELDTQSLYVSFLTVLVRYVQ